MTRAAALVLLGLLLAGIDIPPPAQGVVVDRERIGEVQVRTVTDDCEWWRCRTELVAWRLPEYRITYRWELAGGLISGESRCTVPPGRYWQTEAGQPFRCNPQEGTP